MNYISLIKRFWALNSIQLFSNAETKLFFFLLEEANRLRWPKKFSICTTTMQGRTGVSSEIITEEDTHSITLQDTQEVAQEDTQEETQKVTIIKTKDLIHKKPSKEGKKDSHSHSNSIYEIKKSYLPRTRLPPYPPQSGGCIKIYPAAPRSMIRGWMYPRFHQWLTSH